MDLGLIVFMILVFGLMGYVSSKLPPIFFYVIMAISAMVIIVMLGGMFETLGYPTLNDFIKSHSWIYAVTVPYGIGVLIGKFI